MADAADSKSVALKSVRVQVPPSAHIRNPVESSSTGFSIALFWVLYPLIYPLQTFYHSFHPVSGGFFHLLCHMTVDVQREGYGCMPQVLRYRLDVISALNR